MKQCPFYIALLCLLAACMPDPVPLHERAGVPKASRQIKERLFYHYALSAIADRTCDAYALDFAAFVRHMQLKQVSMRELARSTKRKNLEYYMEKYGGLHDVVFLAPFENPALSQAALEEGRLREGLHKVEYEALCDTAWNYFGDNGTRHKGLLSTDATLKSFSDVAIELGGE